MDNTVYRWVKASERPLPEGRNYEKLSIRYKTLADLLIWYYGNWYWYVTDDFKELFQSKNIIHLDSLPAIEWLEEIPSSSLISGVLDKAVKIEPGCEDLLIYTTVAGAQDEIKVSAIYNSKGQHVMGSLEIKTDNIIFYADNELWITQSLYPALQRFLNREMQSGDKDIINEIIKGGAIYDQLDIVTETKKVIQQAISMKLLSLINVPEGGNNSEQTKNPQDGHKN